MGAIRFVGDVGLYDHEGCVEAELDIDDPMTPGRRWIAYWSNDVAEHFTGRHRAACECGWIGSEVVTGERDSMLAGDVEDDVMSAWAGHLEPFVDELLAAASAPILRTQRGHIGDTKTR